MDTLVAVMRSRSAAERAVLHLEAIGIAPSAVRLVFPNEAMRGLERVPSTDTEAPGVGAVLGGVVGAAGGASLGAAAASLLVPGVGPVTVFGSLAAALFSAVGVAGGSLLGHALDENLGPEVPTDELYVYRDALGQGRFLIVATVEASVRERAREALRTAGAESLDAARADWTIGLRSAERERYVPEAKEEEGG